MPHPRNPPNPETKIFGTKSNWTKSQFEFVPQDTEKSEFANLVDFGDVSFSVETVIYTRTKFARFSIYYIQWLSQLASVVNLSKFNIYDNECEVDQFEDSVDKGRKNLNCF